MPPRKSSPSKTRCFLMNVIFFGSISIPDDPFVYREKIDKKLESESISKLLVLSYHLSYSLVIVILRLLVPPVLAYPPP
jgi:archaellum biogenesis protein FlaJ (TadC family)